VLRLVAFWITTAVCLRAQGIIRTIAGTDWLFSADGQRAVDAPLGSLEGAAVDNRGNVYFSDIDNSLVLRLNANGTVTVIAGNGLTGFSGDGGPAETRRSGVRVGSRSLPMAHST